MKKTALPMNRWGQSWQRPVAKSYPKNWAVETETSDFLYGLIRMIKPLNVLEIGTFEGISAIAIAQACKTNQLGKVLTVDTNDYHQEEYIHEAKMDEWIQCLILKPEDINDTVKRYLIDENLFDVCFIDDGHAYEDARRDLDLCHSVTRKFGYILGHDVIEVADVNNAMNDFLAEHPGEYENVIIASYNGLFILRKL